MTKVLDDGFVEVVDVMGSDSRIAEAARLTSQSDKKDDRNLIRYLMRHRHTTPLEFCVMCFKVRCPMDVWRQWIRHRTASVNEYSTRYSEAIDSMAKTAPDKWRLQSKNNRQGSSSEYLNVDRSSDELNEGLREGKTEFELSSGNELTMDEKALHEWTSKLYQRRLAAGVAKEQARKDLPLSTYTEAYWQINLHNLLHFLGLRMDSHAQYEIRQYANAMGEMVKEHFPITWEAFVDYRLKALHITQTDVQAFRRIIYGFPEMKRKIDEASESIENSREKAEFVKKMELLWGIYPGGPNG